MEATGPLSDFTGCWQADLLQPKGPAAFGGHSFVAVLPCIHLFPVSPAHSHCGWVGRGFAAHFSAEREGHEAHVGGRRRNPRKAGESSAFQGKMSSRN